MSNDPGGSTGHARLRCAAWGVALCAMGWAFAAPPKNFDDRVEALFRPPLAEQMALSPDGRRVAYTLQAGTELHVILMEVDNPRAKVTLNVDEARSVLFSAEKERAQLRFLRWATSDRLVLAPTPERIPLPTGMNVIAPILAVDADGKNPLTLFDAELEDASSPPPLSDPASEMVVAYKPRLVAREAVILGFERDNREQLRIRLSPLRPHQPPDLFSLNIRTGKKKQLDALGPIAWGPGDGRLPLPDAIRAGVTGELARKFPRRKVVLDDWDAGARAFLVSVTGGSDPGRTFVFQRRENLVVEIFRRAPWLNGENLNDARFFEFDSPGGAHLSGYVTWPNRPRLNPPPLLLCFPSGFPGPAQPEFDPEAQVFADLGFVVVRLNHRSVRGLTTADRSVLQAGLDRMLIGDALEAMEWIAVRNPAHPFDRKRIATIGQDFGGYLALRALQLHPDIFRCGIAINAPPDLEPWLNPDVGTSYAPPGNAMLSMLLAKEGTDWKSLSVVAQAEALKAPVFLLAEPMRNVAIEVANGQLRSKLKGLGRAPDYDEIEPGFRLGLPKARVAVYRKLDEFFNLRLYDYGVKVGPAREVK